MASRKSPSVLCQMPLLLLGLFPCAFSGIELAINNHVADYKQTTEPGVAQSLWCVVRNHSRAERLLWLRGDGTVRLQAGNNVNASNICVSPVSIDDNGVPFTCKLARDQSVRISVVLDVLFSPVLSGENHLSVQEENDITLSCHVKANPPAQMAWYKDNTPLVLQKDRHQLYQTTELYRLTIKKTQKSDGGTYTCEANYTLHDTLDIQRRDFHLTVEDGKLAFPLEAVITAAVVIFLTIVFAIVARRERIFKCFKKAGESPSSTAL